MPLSWKLALFILTALLKSACGVTSITKEQVNTSPLLQDFDWKAYCQLYPDLPNNGINTEFLARKHFLEFGVHEDRLFPKTRPNAPGYSLALIKLHDFIRSMDELAIPILERSFLIFHIGKIDGKNSIEVIINNLKIFQSAMELDSGRKSGIFYWFNIVEGQDNMLHRFINATNSNSAIGTWTATPSDIYTHLRTLSLLADTLQRSFSSTFFLNNGVRGPIILRSEGEWIQPFRKLLFSHNNGMVGSSFSCELAPHVQTHFFGIRTTLIPLITKTYDAFHTFDSWPALIRFYEIGLSELVQRSGYNISSLLYQKRLQQDYFTGYCLTAVKFINDHTVENPSRWCDIAIEEVVFYKWGGDMLRTNSFICDATKALMRSTLLTLANAMPSEVRLEIPETLRGGSRVDLFKQFEQEMFRETLELSRSQPQPLVSIQSATGRPSMRSKLRQRSDRKRMTDKVCLLVRTASVHDIQRNASLMNRDVFNGVDNFIRCKPTPSYCSFC
jgi:hypothetical protein